MHEQWERTDCLTLRYPCNCLLNLTSIGTDIRYAIDANVPLLWIEQTEYDPNESAFATTITANDRYMLACFYVERDAIECDCFVVCI
jgi:hypothetical protein